MTFEELLHEELNDKERAVYDSFLSDDSAFPDDLSADERDKIIDRLFHDGYLRYDGSGEEKKLVAVSDMWEAAQAKLDNNPVLEKSPGDLKHEGITVEEYFKGFTQEERDLYLYYYEDELPVNMVKDGKRT